MNTEWSILVPALLAGLLILATHIPLGIKILQRGVIFADLAVAQITGVGVILAGTLGLGEQPIMVQGIAVASALLAAYLLSLIERATPAIREACIGLIFVLAASLGILLLSQDVHAGEQLQQLLAGQILWVNQTQLWIMAALSIVLLALWYRLRQRLTHFMFYGVFALAITASVQLAGIYLVFSSLIIPALTTYFVQKYRLWWAGFIGVGGYVLGLAISLQFDLPAGAAIVWAMATIGAITFLSLKQLKT